MPKCTVVDAETGKTCRWNALKGKDMCWNHDPEARAQHLAACALGGKVHNLKGERLRKPDDILRVIERLVNDALEERKTPAPHAQAILRACDLALKTLDAYEWTERMAALEKKITEEEKRRARAIRDAAEAENWGDPEPQVFLPPQPDDPPWLHRGPGMWVGGKWVYTGETAGTQMNGGLSTLSPYDTAGCTQMTATDFDGNGGERDDPTPCVEPLDGPNVEPGPTGETSGPAPATVGPDGLATSGSRETIRPVQRPGEEGEGGRESEFAPTGETADGRRGQKPAPTPVPAGQVPPPDLPADARKQTTDFALVRGPDGVLRPTLVILEPGKPPRYGPIVGVDPGP